MNKDIVPQDYTMKLALFDAVPVILFGASSIIMFRMTSSLLVLLGGIICFIAGMLKVLWKILVVVKQKNVWFLFEQMRIFMPLGFCVMFLGCVIGFFTGKAARFFYVMSQPLPILFWLFSVAGIIGMIMCAKRLDSVKASSNWIEETCNTLAQGSFLIAMHMAFVIF